ncbi:hypothetical protein NXW91_00035 [Bacteroides fragilis]|nr:hypothetical protein [Bacteroides fragilis]
MDNNVYDYLKFSFDFRADEINKNKKHSSMGRTVFQTSWASWLN